VFILRNPCSGYILGIVKAQREKAFVKKHMQRRKSLDGLLEDGSGAPDRYLLFASYKE